MAPFILLLLDYVHVLIKIAQSINVFVYDFEDFVKLAQAKVVQILFWPLCQVWGSSFWQLSFCGNLDQWNLSYKLFFKPKWWKWWQIFHFFICQRQVSYLPFYCWWCKRFITYHQGYLPTRNHQGERGMWRARLKPCFKIWTPLPHTLWLSI